MIHRRRVDTFVTFDLVAISYRELNLIVILSSACIKNEQTTISVMAWTGRFSDFDDVSQNVPTHDRRTTNYPRNDHDHTKNSTVTRLEDIHPGITSPVRHYVS